MRSPRLEDVIELDGFRVQRFGEILQRGKQFVQAPQTTQPDGSWDGIVGGLCHVDVIVGMDAVLPQFTPQQLCGAVGNHFIDVHVMAGPCASLEGIHDESSLPLPLDHLLRRAEDGIRSLGLCTVKSLRRDVHLSERVTFSASRSGHGYESITGFANSACVWLWFSRNFRDLGRERRYWAGFVRPIPLFTITIIHLEKKSPQPIGEARGTYEKD